MTTYHVTPLLRGVTAPHFAQVFTTVLHRLAPGISPTSPPPPHYSPPHPVLPAAPHTHRAHFQFTTFSLALASAWNVFSQAAAWPALSSASSLCSTYLKFQSDSSSSWHTQSSLSYSIFSIFHSTSHLLTYYLFGCLF